MQYGILDYILLSSENSETKIDNGPIVLLDEAETPDFDDALQQLAHDKTPQTQLVLLNHETGVFVDHLRDTYRLFEQHWAINLQHASLLSSQLTSSYHSTVNPNCLDIRYNIRESLSYVANNTTPLDSSPSVNSNGPDDMFIQHESEPLYFRYNLTTGQTLYILLNPRSELRRQLKTLTARLPPSTLHPFALHTAILFHTLSSCRTQIDNIVKWLLWIETQLHQGSLFEIADADRFSRYIQLLHKMSRSLITLEHSTQRDESNINHLLRDHERLWDLSQKHADGVPIDACIHDRIGDDLRCLRGFCEDRQRHILNLRQRTHSFITLLYNLITGHDSTVNLRIAAQSANIARESRRDSVSMKIIAAVTLLYLPATFVSSLFGTNLVDFNTEGAEQEFIVSRLWWIYVVFAVVLTIATMGGLVLWWRVRGYKRRQKEVESDAGLIG